MKTYIYHVAMFRKMPASFRGGIKSSWSGKVKAPDARSAKKKVRIAMRNGGVPVSKYDFCAHSFER